jgi:hypothetical protein
MNFKKKDIPKEVEIVPGVFYKIKWKRNMGGDYMGLCFYDLKEIWLKQGMDNQETIATLAHEILHSISFEYNIDISHNMIYKLEEALGFLIARNTVWIKWIEA